MATISVIGSLGRVNRSFACDVVGPAQASVASLVSECVARAGIRAVGLGDSVAPFYRCFHAERAAELVEFHGAQSRLGPTLAEAAIADFAIAERHCLPAALLALLCKLLVALENLNTDALVTLDFSVAAWAPQEELWRMVYLSRRPADDVLRLASWRPWRSRLLRDEARVDELLTLFRLVRAPPVAISMHGSALAVGLPDVTAAMLRALPPGASCLVRTAAMAAMEQGDRLFYGVFLDTMSDALSGWRAVQLGSSLLPRMTLEVLRSLTWTWKYCVQAVFAALALHVLGLLESSITSMLAGRPFATHWGPPMTEASNVLRELYFPLRSTLLAQWPSWNQPPGWATPLRRAEDRVMLHWDVVKSQESDLQEEARHICAVGDACQGREPGGSVDGDAFDRQMESVALVVIAVLEDLGAEFWPVGGTLIGVLRYGRLAGLLSEDKVDSTDDDLEFMVGVQREVDWLALAADIERRLLAAGLRACHLRISENSDAFRSRFRPDTLTCGSFKPFVIGVELRSYIIGDGYVFQHILLDIPACATVAGRALPFLCFTYELPYWQHWKGRLPSGLLYPLRRCSLYNHSIPCPARPIEVLRGWNAGEYDLPEYCLAVPLLTQDRSSRDLRNSELARRGLTAADLMLLRRYALELDAAGFASFWPAWMTGVCPELAVLRARWGSRGVCPPARARPQDLE